MKIIFILLAVGVVENIFGEEYRHDEDEDWSDDEQLDYDEDLEVDDEEFQNDSEDESMPDQSFLEQLDLSQTEDEEEEIQGDFFGYQQFLKPLELYFKQVQESILRLRDSKLEAESNIFMSQYSKPSFLQEVYDEHDKSRALRMMRNIAILSSKILEKHNRKHDADEYVQRTSLPQLQYSLPSLSSSSRQQLKHDKVAVIGRRASGDESNDNSDSDVKRRKEKIKELDSEIGKMMEKAGKLQRLMTGMRRIASRRMFGGK